MKKVVVLVSGGGSNLQSIIDKSEDISVYISAVISNRKDAYGLERAKAADIHTEVINDKAYPSRESYDNALAATIHRFQPDLVVLAGFMRILTPEFVNQFRGRMFNIHPSLLPKFKGLHTHQRVLDAGELTHGASVHFVNEELDGGPVIIQAEVPVFLNDSEDELAARVLKQEHLIYPEVIKLFAEGRLYLNENNVPVVDGVEIKEPMRYNES